MMYFASWFYGSIFHLVVFISGICANESVQFLTSFWNHLARDLQAAILKNNNTGLWPFMGKITLRQPGI